MMGLHQQRILITGAAGALGAELSSQAAAQGAQLILLDNQRRSLEALSDRLVSKFKVEPLLLPLDLAGVTPDQIAEVAQALDEQLGGLDVLIHAAARFDGLRPLDQVPPEEWLASIQVNLNAPWLLTVNCLPLLAREGRGRVVFCLDNPERYHGAYWGPYGTSKAALAGMVRQFGEEYPEATIKVLGFNPGPMQSELRSRAWLAESPQDQPDPSIPAQVLLEQLCRTDWTSGSTFDLESGS